MGRLRGTSSTRPLVVGAGSGALAFCFAALLLAPAAAAPVDLSKVALSAKQVGDGYSRRLFQGGRQVEGQVTLNVCGDDYPSEGRRLDRFQAAYVKKSSAVALSNEVVQYRRGWAKQALREVVAHVRRCPTTPVPSGVAGVPPFTYRTWTLLTDRRMLRDSAGWRVTIETRSGGKITRDQVTIIYQVRGDLLSGVFAYGGDPAAQRRLALTAAAASATNLRRA